jgi:hypothetical protein
MRGGTAMPDYLTMEDFLTYDTQMTRRIGRVEDTVEAVREQVSNLTVAFKNYVSETDTYRIANDKRLGSIDGRLDNIESRFERFEQAANSRFDALEQTMNRGFALIFAHLGIQS